MQSSQSQAEILTSSNIQTIYGLSTFQLVISVIASVILIIFIVELIKSIILLINKSKYTDILNNGSSKIHGIRTLIDEINGLSYIKRFRGIEADELCTPIVIIDESCNTLQQYKEYNIERKLYKLISNNTPEWREDLKKRASKVDSSINFMNSHIPDYNNRVTVYQNQLNMKGIRRKEAKQLNIPFWAAKRLEAKIIKKMDSEYSIRPKQLKESACAEIKLEYTSPAGRNHYERSEYITIDTLRKVIKQVKDREEYLATARGQRNLLTPSLRYDVLKRDNFRCQICGRSSDDDNVKLHVDHIIPVSKGGKTELSNLRTLCQDCNLGKSDKYDENGLN